MPVAQRNSGIDAGRIFMALGVIVLHNAAGINCCSNSQYIVAITRCAVPFFLITSGYLLKDSLKGDYYSKIFQRFFIIYLVWMAIYYSVAGLTGYKALKFRAIDFINGGTAYHLWYVPAACAALLCVPAVRAFAGSRITGLACTTIAVAAVLASSYHDVLHLPGAAIHGGILVAPMFVFFGNWLARHSVELPLPASALVAGAGLAIVLGEDIGISRMLGRPMLSHDFTFGTLPYGAGMFLFARQLPDAAWVRGIAILGQFSLGVYTSHVLFIWLFDGAFGPPHLPDLIWRVPAEFGCALVLTMVLRRIPYIRSTV